MYVVSVDEILRFKTQFWSLWELYEHKIYWTHQTIEVFSCNIGDFMDFLQILSNDFGVCSNLEGVLTPLHWINLVLEA